MLLSQLLLGVSNLLAMAVKHHKYHSHQQAIPRPSRLGRLSDALLQVSFGLSQQR